jgi:photosystem II stability/assembly factor-like uncharacterized protein
VDILSGVILPGPTSAGTLVLDTGLGIFRSTDDGAAWTNVLANSTGGMARSLSNPSKLYSAGGCSLLKSTKGGQAWNAVYTNCAPVASVATISTTDPNTVLQFSGSTEYRSTNGGLTSSPGVAIPFSASSLGTPIVSSPDGSLYAAARASGLYKSTDVGLTWTQLSNGAPSNAVAFALSASKPTVLYAADGMNVYKSTTSGASWTTIGPGVGLSYLAADPSNALNVYGSTSGGVILSSTNGGTTWTQQSILDSSTIYGLGVSPSNSAEVYMTNYVPQTGFVSKLSTRTARR